MTYNITIITDIKAHVFITCVSQETRQIIKYGKALILMWRDKFFTKRKAVLKKKREGEMNTWLFELSSSIIKSFSELNYLLWA